MANSDTIQINLKAVADVSDVTNNVKQIQNALNQLKVPPELRAKFNDIFTNIERQAEKASQAISSGFRKKSDITKFEDAMNGINSSWTSLVKNLSKIDSGSFGFGSFTEQIKNFDTQIKQLENDLKALKNVDTKSFTNFQRMLEGGNAPSRAKSWQNFIEGFKVGDIQQMEQACNKLNLQIQQGKTTNTDYIATVRELQSILNILKGNTAEATKTQQELNAAYSGKAKAEADGIKEATDSYNNFISQSKQAAASTRDWGNATRETAVEQQKLNSDLDQLKSRITYFFSATSAVNLFRRAVRKTLETVKDLDKVMTETAVVTSFDVGDMWKQLPEYTSRANELGVSIHDAYEAATLYYQQGLKTNEVMQVSNETLKMARIAGLDAAEATDRMTNALRGFNMAIDENSARNINDVYSNLAAKTASNTDEISTAMTKVASLAHNANMSFENTAAFLSQIIETTRESAETAGTALKTVIARFSEVKDLYTEGQLLGIDAEGEEIDVNRVSTALRTAGINLNEYLTGMKGLDDIFMELSQKWDSLDQVQQRYIATMAAGSRQQSRFIALMQDYSRMTELVSVANNSAGASNEQFEKTLDSLQSKLAQLKNAWNTFLMGIANSSIIKIAVDALTRLLNVLNSITGKLPGLLKSFVNLGIVIAGLKLGRNVFESIFKHAGAAFLGKGKEAGDSFVTGFTSHIKTFFSKGFWLNGALNTKELSRSFGEIATAQNLANEAAENYGKTSQIAIATQNTVVAKNNAYNAALAKTASALGWNTEQTQAFTTMLGMNIKAEDAQLLATSGVTQAKLEEMKATAKQEIETSKGTVATEAEINAKVREKLAEDAETLSTERGILAKIQSTVKTKLNTLAKSGNIVATKLLAVAEKSLTGATLIAAGAMVAFAGVLVGVYFAIKAIVNSTPEAKLKKVEDSAKAAGEAANETKEAYEGLKSAFESIDEKKTAIEEMTEGTQEWKNAVWELNQEILNLIDTYDGLQIEMKDGVLVITKESQDRVTEEYRNASANATAASLAAQAAVANQKVDMARNRFGDFASVTYNGEETTLSLAEQEKRLDKLARAMTGDYSLLSDEQAEAFANMRDEDRAKAVEDLAEDLGLVVNYTEELESAAKSYARAVAEASTATNNLGTGLISTILSRTDLEDEEISAAQGYLESRTQALYESALKGLQEKRTSLYSDADWNDYWKEQIKTMGGTFDRADRRGGIIYHKDGKRQRIDQSTAMEQYAAAQASGEGAERINTLFANLSSEQAKKLSDLYNGNLKLGELKSFGLSEILGTDFGPELILLNKQLDQFKESTTRLQEKGISSKEFENYNLNTVQGLADAVGNMGQEAAQKYVEAFNNAVSSGKTGTEEAIATFLGAVDPSDYTSLIGAMDFMRKNGVEEEAMQEYWDTALEGSSSYINNLEQVTNLMQYLTGRITKTEQLKDNLLKGKATDEDILALNEMGIDTSKFQLTKKGWKAASKKDAEDAMAVLRDRDANDIRGVTNDIIAENEQYQTAASSMGITYRNGKMSVAEGGEGYRRKKLEELGLLQEGASEEEYKEAFDNFVSRLGMIFDGSMENYLNQRKDYADSIALTTEENRDIGGSAESTRMSLENDAEDLGMKEEEIEQLTAYADSLLKVNSALTQQTADVIALRNAKLNLGLSEIIDDYDEWTKLIDENTGLIKASTSADAAAFEKLKKSVNKMLNTEEDLSDKFWVDPKNIANIKKLAEGGEDAKEALEDLQKAAGKDFLENLDLTKNLVDLDAAKQAIEDFSSYLDTTELPQLEAGVQWDDQGARDFIAAFNDMAATANLTADQIQSAVKAMGYDAEVIYTTQTRKLPHYVQTEKRTENPDGTVTIESGTPYITGYDEVTGEFPIVKTLTSTGSGGGGISVRNASGPKGSKSGGGGGGGGSKEKPSYWENPYDELFNLQEKINEALRTREKLERDYQKLLKSTSASLSKIRKDYFDQIKALKQEINLQRQMEAGRLKQIKNIGGQYYTDDEGNRKTFQSLGVMKYANYNENTGLITIDWEGLEAIAKDSSREEEGKAAEAYINKLQELVDQYEEVRDAIWDIEDVIEDMQQEAIDSYLSFEERVMEALVNHLEEQIDRFEEMSNAIEEANNKVFEGIQKQIDEERQARQNEKTEQEIEDKEARLAYLQRDTSGANDLEILQLQKEIDDARQNYQDSLIDQTLNQLKEDADLAAEQRSQQIEVMRAQLQLQKNNGDLWTQVYDLINNATNKDGTLSNNSELVALLKDTEAFTSLSAFGQDEWIKKFVEELHKAQEGLAAGGADKAGDHENSKKVEAATTPTEPVKKSGETSQPTQPTQPTQPAITVGGRIDATGAKIYDTINGRASTQYFSKDPKYTVLEEKNGWLKVRHHSAKSGVSGWFKKSDVKAYKSGGLADFTGPAWLDGSRSKPEVVLDAVDTKNLITLKNILAQLLNGNGSGFSGGDNYFDIDINAEIGSDYDVDRLADRIKKQIQQDGAYRNVNAISYLR